MVAGDVFGGHTCRLVNVCGKPGAGACAKARTPASTKTRMAKMSRVRFMPWTSMTGDGPLQIRRRKR
jgi:hypothetical protein